MTPGMPNYLLEPYLPRGGSDEFVGARGTVNGQGVILFDGTTNATYVVSIR